MRLSIVSDIHGNGRALQAAITEISMFRPDRVVILGDLLTYGPDVGGIFDLTESLAHEYPTDWILGNHEEIYFNLASGDTAYVEKLPEWLQNTIYWTFKRIDLERLASIPWQRECTHDAIYFSHANPWATWRYIQSDEDCDHARITLEARGFQAGVFGHTHRWRFYSSPQCQHKAPGFEVSRGQTAVVNAGSVGQPRNETATSTILNIETDDYTRRFWFVHLQYDTHAHLNAISKLDLPRSTREQLASYFIPKVM